MGWWRPHERSGDLRDNSDTPGMRDTHFRGDVPAGRRDFPHVNENDTKRGSIGVLNRGSDPDGIHVSIAGIGIASIIRIRSIPPPLQKKSAWSTLATQSGAGEFFGTF
jgi:hypothetical protein